jgi:hypothetical protein
MGQWMTKKALTPVRMKKSFSTGDDFYARRPSLYQGEVYSVLSVFANTTIHNKTNVHIKK